MYREFYAISKTQMGNALYNKWDDYELIVIYLSIIMEEQKITKDLESQKMVRIQEYLLKKMPKILEMEMMI